MASVEMRRIYLCEVKFLDVPLAVFDLDRERCIREDADGCLFIEVELDKSPEVSMTLFRDHKIWAWIDSWPASWYLHTEVCKLAR